MTPEPVAFLDSGVGGLPYLAHARKHLHSERFVYVADRENFPYGEKSRTAIIAAALSVAGRLLEREHPRLVVVACNTMSVVALADLRARFPVPFVGVVPAVKPAASLSRRKRVGVLATRQTVEGDYLRNLIVQHASGCDVVPLSWISWRMAFSRQAPPNGKNGFGRKWTGSDLKELMPWFLAALISSTWKQNSDPCSKPKR